MKNACRRLGLISLLCLSVSAMAMERIQSITLKATTRGEALVGFNPIPDGAIMDLAVVGKKFIIYVNSETESDFGSVKIELSGPVEFSKRQNRPPWTVLVKENSVDSTLVPGEYTLACTPYPENALQGEPGETYSIDFTVIDSGPFTGHQLESAPVQPQVTPSWFQEESPVSKQEVDLSAKPLPEENLMVNISEELEMVEDVESPMSALEILILLVACAVILVPGIIVVVKVMS